MNASMPSDAPGPRTGLLNGWYGVGLVALASVIGSIIARGLIPLVSESIRLSLGLDDQQLGLLNGLALTLVTAIATFPVGWLADRIDRRWLLAVCVMIWSAGTVAFGLAAHFPALFLAAVAIALGEAVLGPVTYSMIPDLFPRAKWVAANTVLVATILLGTYIGLALAGTLLGGVTAHAAALPAIFHGLEPWRTTMILVALTGPLLAAMLALLRLERTTPPRSPDAPSEDVVGHFRRHARSLFGIFFGFGVTYAAFGAHAVWTPVIIQRVFRGDPAQIGQILGYVGAACSLGGAAAGALLARRLRPRYGDEAPLIVAQGALLAGLVVALALPFVQTATQYYAVTLAKLGLTFMATSLSPTVLQLIAPARMRGRVVAIGGMVTILFGSFMPWLVGAVSTAAFGGPRGILYAMAVVVIPSLLAGLLILRWGASSVPATLRAVEEADREAVG